VPRVRPGVRPWVRPGCLRIACSSSPRGARRRGESPPRISQRAKRDAERAADLARFRALAVVDLFWPRGKKRKNSQLAFWEETGVGGGGLAGPSRVSRS
jgi:hypothetical protein